MRQSNYSNSGGNCFFAEYELFWQFLPWRRFFLGLLLWVTGMSTWAEVILDGSLGPEISLPGPDFSITADLGQQKGNNLFHSFHSFNLNEGQTAKFSGPASIQAIIGRITNQKPSFIDGQIISTIPHADLYLLNPQGFFLGENASLDVGGSFYLSTANELYMTDDNQFNAHLEKTDILTSAPPEAFGFLDPQPGKIHINNSHLATPSGKTLSLTAQELLIEGGHLQAVSGRIDLVALAYGNNFMSIPAGFRLDPQSQFGDITLTNKATIDVGREGAGNIFIRGERFVLDNSDIFANTSKNTDSGLLVIDAEYLRLANRAKIDSRTFGPGEGGRIYIRVTGRAELFDSNIFTTAMQASDEEILTGNAGDINVVAGDLLLFNSTISTTTYSNGRGGDINININRNLNLTSTEGLLVPAAAIQASSEGLGENAGDAGRINIKARNLFMDGSNSKIDNNTLGVGRGGTINLDIADAMALTQEAYISADSKGLGNAGSIQLNCRYLDLQQGSISTAAIQADGGNILLNVRSRLQLTDSEINATVSGGEGNGGNLAISNPLFFSLTDSRVSANALGGNGGLILIITGKSLNTLNSTIEASSEGGSDGEVKIDIPDVNLSALPTNFLDASMLIKQRCAARSNHNVSRFISGGRGGLPNAPDDLQPYIPSLTDSISDSEF